MNLVTDKTYSTIVLTEIQRYNKGGIKPCNNKINKLKLHKKIC